MRIKRILGRLGLCGCLARIRRIRCSCFWRVRRIVRAQIVRCESEKYGCKEQGGSFHGHSPATKVDLIALVDLIQLETNSQIAYIRFLAKRRIYADFRRVAPNAATHPDLVKKKQKGAAR